MSGDTDVSWAAQTARVLGDMAARAQGGRSRRRLPPGGMMLTWGGKRRKTVLAGSFCDYCVHLLLLLVSEGISLQSYIIILVHDLYIFLCFGLLWNNQGRGVVINC